MDTNHILPHINVPKTAVVGTCNIVTFLILRNFFECWLYSVVFNVKVKKLHLKKNPDLHIYLYSFTECQNIYINAILLCLINTYFIQKCNIAIFSVIKLRNSYKCTANFCNHCIIDFTKSQVLGLNINPVMVFW